jgi:metal-responsive CopG/Arc/MetJ family transcriptional regulator
VEKTETKLLSIMLPEELINRVNAICADKDMTIQEFVTDAIIEKLELVYKERREKPRL